MKRDSGLTIALCRIYAVLLYAYPREFRERFGVEMVQTFRDRCRTMAANTRLVPLLRFFIATAKDWLLSSTRERVADMAMTISSNWQRCAARGLGAAALTVLAYLFITAKVMQAYVIPTRSMEMSLQMGDHILVDKLAHGGEFKAGDLVTFRYPEDQRQTFVKRVIGLPGDHIRLAGKQVIRNGRRLIEPYVQHSTPYTDAYRDNFPEAPPADLGSRGRDMLLHDVAGGEVTVPERSLFVLGDNRDSSLDSRSFGFVTFESVVGRPVFLYWSRDWSRALHGFESPAAEEVAP